MPDYGPLADYHAAVVRGDDPWPRDRLLAVACRREMLHKPGQGWSYSNLGYLFLREILENSTGEPLGDIIARLICRPLGLRSVTLWESRAQSALLHWPAAAGYDPGWVYHGCLIGTAADAARLLHGLFAGDLLQPRTLQQMLDTRPLGAAIAGRPWTRYGYGLGLMSGAWRRLGTAVGHSGAGPFGVTAIYHFPDLPDPLTVACFASGTREGRAERAAATVAECRSARRTD